MVYDVPFSAGYKLLTLVLYHCVPVNRVHRRLLHAVNNLEQVSWSFKENNTYILCGTAHNTIDHQTNVYLNCMINKCIIKYTLSTDGIDISLTVGSTRAILRIRELGLVAKDVHA